MKLRKKLGPYAIVKNIQINIDNLINELTDLGYFNRNWNSAKSEQVNTENLFILSNRSCKVNFNGDDDEGYIEINLSKPNFTSSSLKQEDIEREKYAIYRLKRLDKNKKEYSEHADEAIHSISSENIPNSLKELFKYFKGKVCRVRLANLKAHKNINLHIDYDPSYIFRYHVPLITNKNCTFISEVNSNLVEYYMPADGNVYWINTGIKHGVINASDSDRIHLLIDVLGNSEVQNIENLKFN